MAIGSAPEIGLQFRTGKDMTPENWEEWWQHMRTEWSPNLMAGEGKLVYVTEEAQQRFRRNVLLSVPNLWELGRTD